MYCGYITTIKELRKHSNADRLQCATVFRSNVIVDMSCYEGQRVVYFPVDGQLSEEFAADNNLVRKKDKDGNNIGGYLDPDKRNITAIKLRGEKSDGLVLPIEVLSKYTDVAKLSDGEQITSLDGREICRKYIPGSGSTAKGSGYRTVRSSKEQDKEVSYPFFVEHIDTAQLAFNQDAFRPGDTIYITRKLHGSSFRTANTVVVTKRKRPAWMKRLFHMEDKVSEDYSVVSGTRRTTLRDFDGGFYGSNAFRKKYQDMFVGKLPKGFEVFGEIVGWVNETTPIMPRCSNSKVKDKEFTKLYGKETVFTYGCEPGENDCYIYRITMTNPEGVRIELPTEETKAWCERLGVKYVPILDKFLYTTWDDLNQRCEAFLDVPEPLANGAHVVEGVVVRIDNRPSFTAYKTKSWSFKVLEGIIKDSSEAPDMEESEELKEEIQ
ncbi:MAG: 2'-5' RNA ligase [Oscillospiraceae bacterium]|nr:2'-5' RNA ligase [Oscillospiraceae bacterium]